MVEIDGPIEKYLFKYVYVCVYVCILIQFSVFLSHIFLRGSQYVCPLFLKVVGHELFLASVNSRVLCYT